MGLSLSLTNYSLIPNEMMACGLPVVELSGRASESVYGDGGAVITLADADPRDIAKRLAGLLDDDALRERRSRAGLDFVRSRTWEGRPTPSRRPCEGPADRDCRDRARPQLRLHPRDRDV